MSLQKVIFEILDENVDRLSMEIYLQAIDEIGDDFISEMDLTDEITLEKMVNIKKNFLRKTRETILKNKENSQTKCMNEGQLAE